MRAALREHTIHVVDNGFLPEGSNLEGYEASRATREFPIGRIFDLAMIASDRDPQKLPTLLAALDDPGEPIRWWAAQGCAMLGPRAASAEALLRQRLADPSGAVQVAAAEALARMGRLEVALEALERRLDDKSNPYVALQAANVLDRLGAAARPALPAMKRSFEQASKAGNTPRWSGYMQRILGHAIDVLEGSALALSPARILEKPNPLLSGQVSTTLGSWLLGLFKDSTSEAR